MFGPFSLGDSLRVYRLQRKGISLDLQRVLAQPNPPLWEAWLALVTQQAMGQPTYVLHDPHDGEAFVQLRYRRHQAAVDVVHLAPALDEHDRVANAWSFLLEGACIEAAGNGIQRVFANLPESGPEPEVFRQASFAPYAAEDIYAREHGPARGKQVDVAGLRPQRPEDWPALQKLCVAITPQRVRQAEGGIALAADPGRDCKRYVLPGGNADVTAALTICQGERGDWLRLLVHPELAGETVDALVRWGLALLAGAGGAADKPVYCNVRRHEGGVRGALEAAGFTPRAERSLMVRHTVAWSKAPALEAVPVLTGVETAPPAYRINGQQEVPASNGRLAANREA
jgi:hypothetical protein